MKSISAAIAPATLLALALACDPPPPQGPQQLTYENGYAQPASQQQAPQGVVTYTPTNESPQQPMQLQQVQPQPTATATAISAPTATATPQGPVQMQVTPVPLGVQALPPPNATANATATTTLPAPTANKSMAVPGPGAFQCTSDAQCLLGRCNTQYGRCAYPCKSSENDCKAGNVCTAAGLCMPKGAAGVKM